MPDAVAPPRSGRARIGRSRPRANCLLAAQTSPGSGHKILIQAAGLLSRSGLAGVKFILACDRDESSALDRRIDRTIATEGLQRIKYRTRPCDMPGALLSAAIVVVPATEALSFGDAAVQAQAMGTPATACHLGAAPVTVLVPPMVEEALAQLALLSCSGNAAALALAIVCVSSLWARAGPQASSACETC